MEQLLPLISRINTNEGEKSYQVYTTPGIAAECRMVERVEAIVVSEHDVGVVV
jgi:hypothetical protein